MEFHGSWCPKAVLRGLRCRGGAFLWLLAFISLLLPLFVMGWGLRKMQYHYVLASDIARTEKSVYMREQGRKKQRALCQLKPDTETQFLDDIVAACTFLQPQGKALQELKDILDISGQVFVQEHVKLFSQNQLEFESEEGQPHILHVKQPVYMNLANLEQMMALIEGVRVGAFAPHPLRSDLSFDRITLKRVYNSPGIILVDFTVRKG